MSRLSCCRFLSLACLAAAVVASPRLALAAYPGLPTVSTLPPTLELRQIGEIMVPFQSGVPLPTYDPQLRARIDLSDGWRMWPTDLDHTLTLTARTPGNLAALETEGKGAHRVDLDDHLWEVTRLPAAANPPPAWRPTGVWYRKRVSLPPMWKGQRLFLHCLAANYIADLWVNGRYVGYHEGGFTPFSFDITDYAKWGAANTLALRVDNPPWLRPRGNGAGAYDIVPNAPCDWWNATGVLRDIYLEALPSAALMRADVRSEPAGAKTRVEVSLVMRNAGAQPFAGSLEARLYPARVGVANLTTPEAEGIAVVREPLPVTDGKATIQVVLAANTTLAWRLQFATAKLRPWSPAQPNLYVLEALLKDDQGRVADRLVTQFGLRTLVVDPDQCRLLLNGKPVFLAGLARVEDDPKLGRAFTFRDGLRLLLDLRAAKQAGANFLRLGHFVNHPLTTILADRMGLVCWEEIPVYGFDARGLADQWERRHIARQMLVEMIYQDYNRPSVGFWGACHASGAGEPHAQYLRDLADTARYLDGTRLLGQSASLDQAESGQSECDVQGVAFPITSGQQSEWQPAALATLDRLHEILPRKPIIVTEFGATAGDDAASWQRQAYAARDLVQALSQRPFIAGCAWWTLADYQGPSVIADSGLLTRDRRTLRPAFDSLRTAYDQLSPRL